MKNVIIKIGRINNVSYLTVPSETRFQLRFFIKINSSRDLKLCVSFVNETSTEANTLQSKTRRTYKYECKLQSSFCN